MTEHQAVLARAREVAELAAREAAALARDYFTRDKQVQDKGDSGDLVTVADTLAEEIILAHIRAAFPDHEIRSEETGWHGAPGDWLWLVDPLDGTNNYAIGLPVYGVSITLLYRREPLLGVICDSHLDRLYVAEQGKGAFVDGAPLSIRRCPTVPRMTVGWIQGHAVGKEGRVLALKARLEGSFKRVLRLWAPALQWCMLARGDLDAMVLYNSEGDDLYAGLLLAREAGAAVVDFDGEPFEGMNAEPYLIAAHPDHLPELIALVRDGLKV
ncbi:Histidinol-phosphatase [alternative form] [Paenibacillus pasadenensis]|uniref:Histidinol-phosphatase [alternative form] n=1 Tax=Paenibacillus pasadenensis TaxID=217090 RepID=A0A2N5NB01_9BACL|nr:inositol monophosphatase [Paenibacillus pasadenensis]PLT47529.1 Histidinol-phosphatase [alternative form] [Paenibacillus pasadenensis]